MYSCNSFKAYANRSVPHARTCFCWLVDKEGKSLNSQSRRNNGRAVNESLSQYRLFIGVIFALLGLLAGTFTAFLILRKTPIAIGIGFLIGGVSYLLKIEWQYWAWKEAATPYLLIGPFLAGFGIAITTFALTREVIWLDRALACSSIKGMEDNQWFCQRILSIRQEEIHRRSCRKLQFIGFDYFSVVLDSITDSSSWSSRFGC